MHELVGEGDKVVNTIKKCLNLENIQKTAIRIVGNDWLCMMAGPVEPIRPSADQWPSV
jgi:hypothetical protein